ncbi:MAG: DUF1294 domain-containing protein [Clostridia bacterium]|nr:DUF1294 domain-containing protein [Clostridia bacterium]
MLVISILIVLLNVSGFIIMGIDKAKAKRKVWRIPESTLFSIALVGGSLGVLIGMYVFRHKTKHKSFVIGVPVIFAIHLTLALFFVFFSPFTIRFM